MSYEAFGSSGVGGWEAVYTQKGFKTHLITMSPWGWREKNRDGVLCLYLSYCFIECQVVCFERNLWQTRCCNPLQICKILVLIGQNSLDTNLKHWTFLLSYFRNNFLETFIRTFSAVLYSFRTASSQLAIVFLHSFGNNHLKNL